MNLEVISGIFSICRLDPGCPLPTWALRDPFFSITKTADELSIVCLQSNIPNDVKSEKDWCCLKVKGPLDFALIGILTSLATPLAQAGVSIFAISTFDTDFLLVRQSDFEKAIKTLSDAGHEIHAPVRAAE